MSFIVAIDGPAGTGKGTIASIMSERFNLLNIDSGAIYRALTLEMIKQKIDIQDKEKIIELSGQINVDMHKDEAGKLRIYLNEKEVTEEIRTQEVTALVSQVSSIVPVRLNVVKIQRKLSEGKDIIMEGRDITTYVFPNADVKIYLDANVEERAMRRFRQNAEKGIHIPYEEVLESIKKRDYNDTHKELGALRIADDATVIDTTGKELEENVENVAKVIRQKRAEIKNKETV